VADFTKWHHYAALLNEFIVWVYPRVGSSLEQVLPGMQILTAVQPVTVSSTQAREALQEGRSVAGLLSEQVAHYCRERKLYIKKG
jgi:nicotinate-nucleotide adenylyltransferase